MAKIGYMGLKEKVGLLNTWPCNEEESKMYTEMLQNGQQLPEGILVYKNEIGGYYFYNTFSNAPSAEKEELFVLMKIYNDIHFIKNMVLFALIAAVVGLGILFIIA